jgi:hypothetical protein
MITYNVSIPNFKFTAHTAGNGMWSNEDRKIEHAKAYVSFFSREERLQFKSGKIPDIRFAELRVYFPKRCWDVDKYGLIYTDRQWIKELRQNLTAMGFSTKAVKDVDYSEQGLQGENYVSLDAGRKFLKELIPMIKKVKSSE